MAGHGSDRFLHGGMHPAPVCMPLGHEKARQLTDQLDGVQQVLFGETTAPYGTVIDQMEEGDAKHGHLPFSHPSRDDRIGVCILRAL